ncbi:cobalamin biosynthesis protein [Nocardioides sp. DS6]|uniref:Cobalamin biosynthesis protein CobD n=1 Tax=Nocardioides eburneus TaxID=3231482 RepID=A0ABV3T1M1_9ACTN
MTVRQRASATAAGLVLGYAADAVLGDPRRFHPVAGFGTVASHLEHQWYDDRRLPGAGFTLLLVAGTAGLGLPVRRLRSPILRVGLTALATWAVLGGRSLDREAAAVERLLGAGDLATARVRLTHLVGRDTSCLDESGVARAVVESVAENSSDAVVAPLLWGAVAGVPGLLGYRAANTLDAMVGHRSARYERFGWAAARLDDVLNLPGARLAGLLTAVVSPRRSAAVVRVWRRDAGAHPSPNAGVVEAAFAGALDLTLGGTNTYGTGADRWTEQRARLGDGPAPTGPDIARARRLARRLGLAAAVTSAAMALGTAAITGRSSRSASRVAATARTA